MTSALVAGASGRLGRHLVAELRARDYRTTALLRNPAKSELVEADETVALDLLAPDDGQLDAALAGVDLVFSAAGQSCAAGANAERDSFAEVDTVINRALLAAALRNGVGRFAYVAVLGDPRRRLAYVDAHERFVDELVASEIEHTVIRANGFFCSYLELLEAARRGPVPSFGDGAARSNPIHEADLAIACVDALEGSQRQVAIGGPEELSRREEIELVFAVLDRRPRTRRVPIPLLKATLPLLRLRDRRRAEMIEFIAAINRRDVLASPHGERRLGDYLAEHG